MAKTTMKLEVGKCYRVDYNDGYPVTRISRTAVLLEINLYESGGSLGFRGDGSSLISLKDITGIRENRLEEVSFGS